VSRRGDEAQAESLEIADDVVERMDFEGGNRSGRIRSCSSNRRSMRMQRRLVGVHDPTGAVLRAGAAATKVPAVAKTSTPDPLKQVASKAKAPVPDDKVAVGTTN